MLTLQGCLRYLALVVVCSCKSETGQQPTSVAYGMAVGDTAKSNSPDAETRASYLPHLAFADTVFQDYSWDWRKYLKNTDTVFSNGSDRIRIKLDIEVLPDSFSIVRNGFRETRPFKSVLSTYVNDSLFSIQTISRSYGDTLFTIERVKQSGEWEPQFYHFDPNHKYFVLTQHFYYPESDIIGRMFYCIDLQGSIILTGNASWGGFDFSHDGNMILACDKIFVVSPPDTIDLRSDLISPHLLTDSLLLGFRKTPDCGYGVIENILTGPVDSFPFCGFDSGISEYIAAVEREKTSRTILAFEYDKKRLFYFTETNSPQPRSLTLHDLNQEVRSSKPILRFWTPEGYYSFYFDSTGIPTSYSIHKE
ncbi:MAG: hypothetical protein KDC99_19540 [Cyclobacteriaceae bacterium]|nr:hypothetical protein [Cyclobacteriaceae bacterium]